MRLVTNMEDMLLISSYLEGQGDLVSRLITPITHIVTRVIPVINLLAKSLTLQVESWGCPSKSPSNIQRLRNLLIEGSHSRSFWDFGQRNLGCCSGT